MNARLLVIAVCGAILGGFLGLYLGGDIMAVVLAFVGLGAGIYVARRRGVRGE